MLEENQFGKGSLDRPEDFLKPEAAQHSEIAAAFQPAPWEEKNEFQFATYPKRDQGMKSDCVLYSSAKALSIDELSENGKYRELSPDMVYPFVVVPGGGSRAQDAMKFIAENGMTLEHLYPSDSLTEEQAADPKATDHDGIATDARIIARVYKPSRFIECSADFETIASILHSFKLQGVKKGVMVTVVGQNNGTWLTAFPQIPSSASKASLWYHRIVVTDFGILNGKKTISFDNSWGTTPGNGGQQFLTEEYQPFMYGAAYTINQPDLALVAPIAPPVHAWTAQLQVGDRGPDVLALQQALQSMGMFPVDKIVKPTGYFGGITKEGVELFQAAFGVSKTGILDQPTIDALNNVFKG